MNLYLIKASDTDDVDWDEYIGAVVAAEDESAARRTHPSGSRWWDAGSSRWRYEDGREAYSDALRLLCVDDVAAILRTSRGAVHQLISRGLLRVAARGPRRRPLMTPEDVTAYLTRHEQDQARKAASGRRVKRWCSPRCASVAWARRAST